MRRTVNYVTGSISTGFFCYQGKQEDVRNSNALRVQADTREQWAEGKTCLHVEKSCSFKRVVNKIKWK